MEHFSWVVLVIALGLLPELLLDRSLDFRETLQSVGEAPEPLVLARVDAVVLVPCPMEDLVDRRSGDPVFSYQIADADMIFEVLVGEFFSLVRGQSCLLVDYHIVSKNCYF